MTFTHLDDAQHPTMVDVSDKRATRRTAAAQARVLFPAPVAAALRYNGFRSAKGPIFDTAIVAGVMAAKRTHELIPFCHPLGIENCRVSIDMDGDSALIRCEVSVHHKTGVEMEALTGASVAALTIYDMCKALSHDIVIADTRLLSKHGGKSDYVLGAPSAAGSALAVRSAAAALESEAAAPVYGLILAGGLSSRMQRDKAALVYEGQTQLDRAFEMVGRHVEKVFVSVRATQSADPTRARRPLIVDSTAGADPGPAADEARPAEAGGPIVGIRSALAAYPGVAWLVVACDLPFLSDTALEQLLRERDPEVLATAFRSTHDGLPEPLCAVWEPASAAALAAHQQSGKTCPRKFLINHPVKLLDPHDARALDNVNTPDEYAEARLALNGAGSRAQRPCN